MSETITVIAPGRVNLIGGHTDYTGGLAMPLAIDRATRITGEVRGGTIRLTSATAAGTVEIDLDAIGDPSTVEPAWGRYVAAVAALVSAPRGVDGHIESDIPAGAGLSSSASLELAVALAVGFEGTPLELATLGRQAEHDAVGVPCGIMDQYAIAAGRAGHALLMDCHELTVDPVPIPDDVDIVVVPSGQRRTLAGSGYAERTEQCAAAEAIVGPLRSAGAGDLEQIDDEVIRRRARHVISENQRVRDAAAAWRSGRVADVGALIDESHASLAHDYDVSTPIVDQLVSELRAQSDVLGVRITGAGFGGCVVALTRPGALDVGWNVRASDGARIIG